MVLIGFGVAAKKTKKKKVKTLPQPVDAFILSSSGPNETEFVELHPGEFVSVDGTDMPSTGLFWQTQITGDPGVIAVSEIETPTADVPEGGESVVTFDVQAVGIGVAEVRFTLLDSASQVRNSARLQIEVT